MSSKHVKGGIVCVILTTLLGCGASGKSFDREEIPAGKAIAYVYRSGSIVGAASQYHLYANEKYVANITNGGYAVVVLSPGHVQFRYQSGSALIGDDILLKLSKHGRNCGELMAEPGHEYFLKVNMSAFGMKLVAVQEPKAISHLGGLRQYKSSNQQ